jgi:hypothetical protein
MPTSTTDGAGGADIGENIRPGGRVCARACTDRGTAGASADT